MSLSPLLLSLTSAVGSVQPQTPHVIVLAAGIGFAAIAVRHFQVAMAISTIALSTTTHVTSAHVPLQVLCVRVQVEDSSVRKLRSSRRRADDSW
jgi:hypothetical protein